MKAFLYARVSTGDQNEGMQFREMRELAHRRGVAEIEVFSDVASGAKDRRPELDRMMELVRRGKCDLVIVYRFDRFARSLRQLINALEEFHVMGVQFISVHEAIDTTTAAGKLMFHLIAAFAEFERELIRERTRSGIANARARGKHIGRPIAKLELEEIDTLRALGAPWKHVWQGLGVSESTLRRFRRKATGQKSCQKDADQKGLEDKGLDPKPVNSHN